MPGAADRDMQPTTGAEVPDGGTAGAPAAKPASGPGANDAARHHGSENSVAEGHRADDHPADDHAADKQPVGNTAHAADHGAVALHDLARLAAAPSVPLDDLRRALGAARAAIIEECRRRWPPPGEAARRLTAVYDALCRGLVRRSLAEACTDGALAASEGDQSLDRESGHRPALPALRAALVAVGGYGRAELAPGSDLDLVVLCEGPADRGDAERLAGACFPPLWDLGAPLAHAVRTLEDLDRAFDDDVSTATALLTPRHLAGDARITADLVARGQALLAGPRGPGFLHRKLEELTHLHLRHGHSPSLCQPHVKAGAGGLRDHELLDLADRLGMEVRRRCGPLFERDRAALERARRDLLDLRFAMHMTEGRKQDRLSLELAADVFGLLGGPIRAAGRAAVEHGLRARIRAARLCTRALRLVAESVDAAMLASDTTSGGQIPDGPGGVEPTRVTALAHPVGASPVPAPHTPGPAATPAGAVEGCGTAFVERRGRLEAAAATSGRTALAGSSAAQLVEPFVVAQREGLELSAALEEAVRAAVAALPPGVAEDGAAIARLGELFRCRRPLAPALEAMHRTGLLGELLPEVGAMDALCLADPYHEYAVDAHALRAVAMLEQGPGPGALGHAEDPLRSELIAAAPRLHVLRLGALLHDMGKSKGGDHVRTGADMVADIARRLRLDLEEARLLRFLVARHMLLADAASRRDPHDPATIAALAQAIDSVERLDLLYVLTVADGRAVGSHAFPRWKDALLTGLWRRVRERLRGEPPRDADPALHRRDTLAELARLGPPAGFTAPGPAAAPRTAGLDLATPAGDDEAAYDAHIALCPRRYLVEVEPAEAARHLHLARRLAAGEDPALAHRRDGPLHHVWVVTRDRTGLFARMAGAVAASRASIVAADLYTRTDGVVLDRVTLALPEGPGGDDDSVWPALAADLRAVLRDERAAVDLLRAGERRIRIDDDGTGIGIGRPRGLAMASAEPGAPRPAAGPPAAAASGEPVQVRASNKVSDRYTVVDVVAPDRIGLLYDLSLELARLGVDIHGAKVGTRGRRAIDVFYVARSGRKLEEGRDLVALERALAAAAASGGTGAWSGGAPASRE